MKELEEQTLKTLSYLEPMSLEKIYLDFDSDFLANNPQFTVEDLLFVLQKLKKKKLVRRAGDKNSIEWIRVFPRSNSLLAKIKSFLKIN